MRRASEEGFIMAHGQMLFLQTNLEHYSLTEVLLYQHTSEVSDRNTFCGAVS